MSLRSIAANYKEDTDAAVSRTESNLESAEAHLVLEFVLALAAKVPGFQKTWKLMSGFDKDSTLKALQTTLR